MANLYYFSVDAQIIIYVNIPTTETTTLLEHLLLSVMWFDDIIK